MAGRVPGTGPGGPGAGSDGRQTRQIKVRLPEAVGAGVYANSMMVQHTREEFILDFAMIVGDAGTVVTRVVTSPGHVKRIVKALQENLAKYEGSHGRVDTAPEAPFQIGFQPATDA
ncbi:MAG: DUF3467 domain-containing protein [Thermoleophilia bacterium]|nr:DUF3467 domain-containing protein [Thermoleophilia bacterium]